MLTRLLTTVFGSKQERDVKRLRPVIEKINGVFATLRDMPDERMIQQTEQWQSHLRDNPDRETEILDEILPEAFAFVKEACRRLVGKSWEVTDVPISWDMVPFDVQLVGAIVLHEGRVAEMATGEGKTLVATLPLYLNALVGKGVHLVTVNDYLARRDSEWMGKVYESLGLSVGCIQHDMMPEQRKPQYCADITYGTNNEFGFDYLRDNMSVRAEDRVQRGHYYAIVDEVDSVLIDEARTPLIISGPVSHSLHRFHEWKSPVERLMRVQTALVNDLLAEAVRMREEGKEYESATRLLQVQRGAPKNKRFLKLVKEPGVQKSINRVEADFMRDKRLGELDEELYFAIDEKGHSVDLTDKGREHFSPTDHSLFVLPDLSEELQAVDTEPGLTPGERAVKKQQLMRDYAVTNERIHNIGQLLKAYSLFERDVEYVVQEGKVLIVDEFTGRLMPGRRYSDGLHSALEAKEGVQIEQETQTLATITLQNYFRLYRKLAGMTGTAETEAPEFHEIYKLDVVMIPTNESVRRQDYDDVVYKTRREKYGAVIDEIVRQHERGRPVLVGTVSVEVSETLSRLLKRQGIRHSVLNAKYHQQEAQIVSQAGQPGVVTIATNMAGRGTDIKLGPGVVKCSRCSLNPSPEWGSDHGDGIPEGWSVAQCRQDMPCGLHILGTERHEARRIDRQLRGRSGRQGDPGSSRFFLALEDDLMRLFGSDRVASIMDRMGAKEGEAIEHGLVTRAIQTAQKRVEAHNFDIRKHLLEYDNVMNQQREVIYARRAAALEDGDLRAVFFDLVSVLAGRLLDQHCPDEAYPADWNLSGLRTDLARFFLLDLGRDDAALRDLGRNDLAALVQDETRAAYEHREQQLGAETLRHLEKLVTLRVIDERWRDHLYELDQLKAGVGLRAYGQKDPLLEYKQDAFQMFVQLLDEIDQQIVETAFKAELVSATPVPERRPPRLMAHHPSVDGSRAASEAPATVRKERVGRNDPCPCGSGKKYKRCHGQTEETV
ncbi:MAG: preprotein translocase subunit SecA [Candidatus Eisenbacteria bacterium]|jgi:preprotein translocase subunit SecA|nr:preprotein translocase subunit SecA [Candidatus Eisenbacteria bacterium]